jgi:hypothetical protein
MYQVVCDFHALEATVERMILHSYSVILACIFSQDHDAKRTLVYSNSKQDFGIAVDYDHFAPTYPCVASNLVGVAGRLCHQISDLGCKTCNISSRLYNLLVWTVD